MPLPPSRHMGCPMRKATAFALVLLSTRALAEDPQLRARAFELIEHSRQVATVKTSQPVPNETVLSFRATGPDGVVREGSYSRLYAGRNGTREEFTEGDFHLVRILLPDRVAWIGPNRVLPAEMREMLKLVPQQLWHLDDEDIVSEIRSTNRKGVAAQCIEFQTVRGQSHEQNELCFDASTGAQIYDRSANMELENSAFFDFKGALQPAKISQYRGGSLILDIQLTRKVIDDPVSTDLLTPPPGAAVGMRCEAFTRPFGQSMPQPPGEGLQTNIVVHGIIGVDGKVHDAAVESSERPDLNAEAIKVVQTWTFTPATCNGHPNPQEASMVVHFHGR